MINSKKIKVSVCVMTYNQELYIEQCLTSVAEQKTDFPIEIVIGDDCSTDSTREKIIKFQQHYNGNIVLVFQSENSGGKKNYPSIHRAAQGEYVCHLDGDDWMEPGKLQKQVDFLDRNPSIFLTAHQMHLWTNEKRTSITRRNPPEIDIDYLIINHPLFLHSSIMYKRAEIGGVFATNQFFIDFYLYVYSALRSNIGFINQPLGNYRQNIGISSSGRLMPQIQSAIDLVASVRGETKSVRRGRAKQYLSYALLHLRKNNSDEFQQYIRNSRIADPAWAISFVISRIAAFPSFLSTLLQIYKRIRHRT
jgi:glycosyltransferase involved in cell wall biosynthesis